ncbi:MAG: DctP family TRAP transporter solute-binding subunit [Pseudomonadota bacterium]|nr:DctP family TRAP transporter solute-binding subunit [Pseudomonadota bacterium]
MSSHLPHLASTTRRGALRFGLAGAGMLVAGRSAWASKPIEIRVAHALQEGSHLDRAVTRFAEEVQTKSSGRLIVTQFASSRLGSDLKVFEQMHKGGLPATLLVASTTTLVPASKAMAIWDTPFLFHNPAEAYAVLDGKYGQQVLASLSQGNIVGLAYWENGFRQITNSVRPITRLDDFAGLRMRVRPDDIAVSTFKQLGVDAKPLPFGELPQALRERKFDGQENPYATIVSARIHEVQNYLNITNHLYTPYGFIASKGWWDTLAPDLQKIVREAAWNQRTYQRAESRRASEEALGIIKSSGIKISELSVIERNRIVERLTKVNVNIVSRVGTPLWANVAMELDDFRHKARSAAAG